MGWAWAGYQLQLLRPSQNAGPTGTNCCASCTRCTLWQLLSSPIRKAQRSETQCLKPRVPPPRSPSLGRATDAAAHILCRAQHRHTAGAPQRREPHSATVLPERGARGMAWAVHARGPRKRREGEGAGAAHAPGDSPLCGPRAEPHCARRARRRWGRRALPHRLWGAGLGPPRESLSQTPEMH